jgi:hypothetical protein
MAQHHAKATYRSSRLVQLLKSFESAFYIRFDALQETLKELFHNVAIGIN